MKKRLLNTIICGSLAALCLLATGCKKQEKEPTIEKGPKPNVVAESIGSVNLARRGYAMASSSKRSKGYSNLNLNDGDVLTSFSASWEANPNETREFYFYVDLTEEKTLDKMVLYPAKGEEKAFPAVFEIHVSKDGKEYSLIKEFTTDPSQDYSAKGFTA